MAKPKAKSFMTGAALGGGNFNDQVFARKKAKRAEVIAQQEGGLLMSAASAHPRYYEQKRAAEKRLGRALSNEEFERDHWSPPADSPASAGTSIFDPVLCELAYRWWCPQGGTILDPFAGGSVRGIVASKLGRPYVGVDLRAEQVEANIAQAAEICGDPLPDWRCGDSRRIHEIAAGVQADFIFSCPPYADLEVYSDDPRDISTMGYPDFREAYFDIIARACGLLKRDRFACFVVGDARGKDGAYYGLVPDTVRAFQAAGLAYYNEAVLVTSVGSLPIRIAKQFEATRKLGKTHQNVLVFCKGDPRAATAAIGQVEFGEIAGSDDQTLSDRA